MGEKVDLGRQAIGARKGRPLVAKIMEPRAWREREGKRLRGKKQEPHILQSGARKESMDSLLEKELSVDKAANLGTET